MWGYKNRLQADVQRWKANGWLTPAGEAGITDELARKGRDVGLASVLAVLAAALLGFAAMTFVASNWDAMPRIARLGLLFSTMWLSYLGAGALFARGHDWLAHAAVLLGASIFGASIMLIAQMFHIDGNPPDGVLTWAIGALLAAVSIPSAPTLGLAAMLVGLWAGWETTLHDQIFWPFLIGWAAISTAAYFMRWSPGRHFSGLLFAGWAIMIGPFVQQHGGFKIVIAIGLAVMVLGLILAELGGDLRRISRAALGYGLVIAGAGLFTVQFVDTTLPGDLILWGIASLALTLAAVAWGMRTENRGLIWLGYVGFAVEVLGLYFKTVGTLLGTSTFFLSAGVIVLLLAVVAYRIHGRQLAAEASA